MTPAELARVRRRLVAFAAEVFQPLARADQRRWGECYLRGLMLDGKRKSIQPMAERLPDGNERALQQFLSQSPWDWRPVRQRLTTQMTAAITRTPGSWMTPSRDPGRGRPRVPHPGAAAPPAIGGVGLTLWQLLGELQALLACWAGACPTCKRPAPRWLGRRGRSPAPT
jgi:hypothetical protein